MASSAEETLSGSSLHVESRARSHGVDRCLAAEPARARREERPSHAFVGWGDARGERKIEDVESIDAVIALSGAVSHRHELFVSTDHALAHEESGGEIEVGAGRAHGDRERRAADANLQWLFARQGVSSVRRRLSDGHSKHVSLGCNAAHFVLMFSGILGRATEQK